MADNGAAAICCRTARVFELLKNVQLLRFSSRSGAKRSGTPGELFFEEIGKGFCGAA